MSESQLLWMIVSWSIIIVLVIAAVMWYRGKFAIENARLKRLKDSGVSAPGTITQVEDTGATINDNPQVTIAYRVTPPAGLEFEAVATMIVSRLDIPREGEQFEIWYDPQDTSNFGIGRRLTTPAGVASGNLVSQLERAAQLLERGHITAGEFENLKRQVLGQ